MMLLQNWQYGRSWSGVGLCRRHLKNLARPAIERRSRLSILTIPGHWTKDRYNGYQHSRRQFKIPLSDYYSVDISADVHVHGVFSRLGLICADASIDELTYVARSLNPEFPGLLDLPAWDIGRKWCRP
jgi:hypothetical protein